jgi:hypothetical protein
MSFLTHQEQTLVEFGEALATIKTGWSTVSAGIDYIRAGEISASQ